ncbi:PTS beta-glucoside transporter subunit EIIBCA [Paenibacillus oralis]|uniref:PTS beta-glucoside transporter subunit EIIBCA n=1 Tax=Paenibacillus oralis TaxID=2490856 RepID=A0A3P3U2W5_9BACL|nr:beta-glucoside-specific PTS transporter subunit IIABC [Paenibacillus oralis]RRJ64661.1 PTS beta-glucoside transporter subunit EIIBCA [Paenibacillus oralis]
MDNKEMSKKIIEFIGGKDNISELTHCVTRLRFVLKDEAKAQTEEIEKLNVLGVQKQGGQYQIIVGDNVGKLYNEIIEQIPGFEDSSNQAQAPADTKKESIFNRLISTLSSILVKALPPLVGGGMLKGILYFFTSNGWLDPASSLGMILDIASSCMFYFFPFLLAVSAAQKFKTNEYMALSLAGALMYPSIIKAASEGADPIRLFGLPIPMLDYSSSVIPIILSVLLLKYVYGYIQKIMPSIVNSIFTPLLTIIIMVPVSLSLLAPLGYYGGNYLAYGIDWIVKTVPWLAGFVIGAIRPFLVLTGMHHAIRPILLQQIATFGYTNISPANFLSTMAQATSTLAVYMLIKEKSKKQLALSSTFSGFLGVTEPALYGIIIKYKAALIGTVLGGGIGGMVATIMGAKAYASSMPSIFSIPVYAGGGFASILVGLLFTLVATFVITIVLGKGIFRINPAEPEQASETETKAPAAPAEKTSAAEQAGTLEIFSPVSGNFLDLKELNDRTFSEKLLGEGLAIVADQHHIVAPADGKLTVYRTNHAVGIETDAGVELLIHVGIDTVKLKGKHFKSFRKTGDVVKKGDILLEFDKEAIEAEGYNSAVVIIVTNPNNYASVQIVSNKPYVGQKDVILTLK